MSARNPGAPAVRNITNYHAYVRAVRSNEVEAVRQALESDPSYMQYEATSVAVAGRRSGHLAAARRVFESKDMTRAIARFLARKFRSRVPLRAVPDYALRDAGRFP